MIFSNSPPQTIPGDPTTTPPHAPGTALLGAIWLLGKEAVKTALALWGHRNSRRGPGHKLLKLSNCLPEVVHPYLQEKTSCVNQKGQHGETTNTDP